MRERKYIDHRRATIAVNLKSEIDRISTVDPENIQTIDKKQFRQKQGKNLIQHYKKVFKDLKNIVDTIEVDPKVLLGCYIICQKNWLEDQLQILTSKIPGLGIKSGINDVENLIASQTILEQLGDKQIQVISSAIDEKMYLERKRSEIEEFEELVFKIAVVIERVNFYTTGIIFPRD